MNETKTISTIDKINDFYASSKSLVIFVGVAIAFGLLQIVWYLFGFAINGDVIGGEGDIFVWIAIAVSITSCIVGFIGAILVVRGSLHFIWFNLSQMIVSFFMAVLSGMWLMGFASLVGLLTTITRWIVWRFEYIKKWNLNDNKVLIGHIIFLIILLIILNMMEFVIPYDSPLHTYPGSNEVKASWTWYFDATSSSLNIAARVLTIFKSRWCFALYLSSKTFAIANYAYAGMLLPIVQMMMFGVIDVTAFIGWKK